MAQLNTNNLVAVDDITNALENVSLDESSLLKEQLKSLECPFTWLEEYTNSVKFSMIQEIEKKLEEIDDEELFPWRTFNLKLMLCYEYCRQKSYPEAREALKFCEKVIINKSHKGIYEAFYQATKDALHSVFYSCKCFLHHETGDHAEVKRLLRYITKYEDMNNECKATIWGMKATAVMEYGPDGTKASYDFVKRAIELDSKQKEWLFLRVKVLGRFRRREHRFEHTKEELDALEALDKDIEKTNNASYMIFLAQNYREVATIMHHRSRTRLEKEKVKNLNLRSAYLYKKSLQLRSDCGHINIRCAEAFLKMPIPYKDVRLALECRDKALMLAPKNVMVNHVSARLYANVEGDKKNAKKYYKAAAELGGFGSYMELFKLYYEEDKLYNPISDFERLLERFKDQVTREKILCKMGSYYYFMKDDLATAFRYWRQVMDDNPDSHALKKHKFSFIPHMRTPVSIYILLFDEARMRISDPERKSDEESTRTLKDIIDYIEERFPELAETSPKPRRKMAMEEGNYAYWEN